jgi:glycolate oxidase iron-sulfur subunit
MSAGDRIVPEASADRAWPDKSAPPEEFRGLQDHVISCTKCGFCQPVCPIFRATGREASVARGKIALYRNIGDGRLQVGPPVSEAFSNCLLCRACTEACFPGIRTDDVVVSFRHDYGDRFGRGFWQRRVFRTLLPRPSLMRILVRAIWALRRWGLDGLLRRSGVAGLVNPKLERALELGGPAPGALLTSRLKRYRRRRPHGRAGGSGGRPRVGYWISCGYNYVLPEVGEATVRVLERLGYEVEVLNNACCGLAAYGYGDVEAAAELARVNLRRLGDVGRFEAIVSECGSCSGHLKEYTRLLAEDWEWRGRAEALTAKVRSFSEFVVERGGLELSGDPGAGTSEALTVTYHDPCHLGQRYQNVVDQPRQLLRELPGVVFVEMDESGSCCGAAGTFGMLHPETSAAIIGRKMGFVRATGAEAIVTECPSCMMQLRFGAREAGLPVTIVNISQLCDSAATSHQQGR